MLHRMQDDVREVVAANARAEIARKGENGTSAARALGMSKQSMSVRLSGERPFRAEEIAKLAEWLGVSTAVLLRIDAPVEVVAA